MAAAMVKEMDLQDDDLCCYICLELYDKPRILPCLHSFCHICLVGYAKRAFDEGKQTINCPICRAETKDDKSVVDSAEKWVECLPIDVALVSVLSSKKIALSNFGIKCDQCQRLGDEMEEPAIVYCYECSEKLCEKCKEMHEKVKISSSHILYDIKNKQEDVTKIERLKSLTRCPKHLSEEVRYICKDHDQLCCNECAFVTHRKCNALVSVVKEQIEMGKYMHGTCYKLNQLIEYLEELIGYETKHQINVKAYETEMKDKVKQIKKRIDTAFHGLEKAVSGEFEEKSSLILKESALHKAEIESLKSEVKHSLVKFETAKEFGQPLHMYLVDRLLQNELATLENMTREIYDKMSKIVVHMIEDKTCKELEQKIGACLRIKMEPSGFGIPPIPRIFKYKSWLEAVESTDIVSSVHRKTKAHVPVVMKTRKQNVGLGIVPNIHHPSNTKTYAPIVEENRLQERNKHNNEYEKSEITVRNVELNVRDNDFSDIDGNDPDLESVRHFNYSRLQKKEKRKNRKI